MRVKKIIYTSMLFILASVFLLAVLVKIIQLSPPLILNLFTFLQNCFNWALREPTTSTSILIIIILYSPNLFLEKLTKTKNNLISNPKAESLIKKLENENCNTLLIKGEWGIGKTSFYNGSLEPLLKNSQSLKKFGIIYISCSGLNTADELVNEILNKCMPLQWTAIFSNRFKQICTASLNFRRGFIPKNQIIVLDDFERVTNPQIYKDLFGLIDYLIREKTSKFIIMCNEDEIKNNGDKIGAYRDMREKIVDHTHNFKPSTEMTKIILEKNGIKKDVMEKFINLFDAKSNFRAIIRASYDFKALTEKIENYCEEQAFDKSIRDDLLNEWNQNCNHELALMYIKSSEKTALFQQYQTAYVKTGKLNNDEKELRSKHEFKFFSDLDARIEINLGVQLTPAWLESYFTEDGIDGISDDQLIKHIENLQYNNIYKLYHKIFSTPYNEMEKEYNKFKDSIIEYLKKLSKIHPIEKTYWPDGSYNTEYITYPIDIYFLCEILIELKQIEANEAIELIKSNALKKLFKTYRNDLFSASEKLDRIIIPQATNSLPRQLLEHLFDSHEDSKDRAEYDRIVTQIKKRLQITQDYDYKKQNTPLKYTDAELIYFLNDIRIHEAQTDYDILFTDEFLQKIATGSIVLIEEYIHTIKQNKDQNSKKALERLYKITHDTTLFHKRLKKSIKAILKNLE